MSGKWTPGPWAWCKDRPTDVIVSKPCECSLAIIDVGCGNDEERRSNARLIATAPELAEALEALLSDARDLLVEAARRSDREDLTADELEERGIAPDSFAKARAALAKAMGEGA